MKDVVVIGAGKIGATIAGLLASTSDYQVIPLQWNGAARSAGGLQRSWLQPYPNSPHKSAPT